MRPAIMQSGKWGREVDFNLFTTSEADRLKFAANGCDANSLTGDPLFTSREAGDYQVKGESPAIKLGFQNFSMDDFGVQKPELKRSLARRSCRATNHRYKQLLNDPNNRSSTSGEEPSFATSPAMSFRRSASRRMRAACI